MGRAELPKVIDFGNAPEVFCSALGKVELLGGNARFTLVTHQTGQGNEVERVANLKVIMPTEAVGPGIELTLQTLSSGLIVPVTKFITNRLFH